MELDEYGSGKDLKGVGEGKNHDQNILYEKNFN